MANHLSPRFILEDNLIRLAKWLRIMGYDAAVHRAVSLSTLISLANKEKRVFITRSNKIFKLKQRFPRFLIKSDKHLQQLQELKNYIELEEDFLFTRCTHCNTKLNVIEKEKIEKLVPEVVYQSFEDYYICRRCGRIYWQGSHYKRMKLELQKIFNR